jgi:hypothetical protein
MQGLPLWNLLPSATESLIYGSIGAKDRNSLLTTSRWGRDAVLREARSVSLSLQPSDAAAGASLRPLARLLARACEAAEAGRLSVSLNASQTNGTNSTLLAQLLDTGIKASGWTSVSQLSLRVSNADSANVGVCICCQAS